MIKSLARGCATLLALLLITGLGAVIFRVPLMTRAARCLVEDDGAHHADLAVVLGGDEFGDRVLTAGRLATEGYVPRVLISFPFSFSACDSSKQYAETKGYPAALFDDLPNHTKSTREEVALLDKYLREHGIHSILLVTSNYHTRRAAYLMRSQDSKLKMWVIAAPDLYFAPDRWWKTREGQKTFLLEWAKTVATWLGD